MTDIAWIDTAITSARPQAIAALLRYFRDLDTAEEAFQDACLRALKSWPKNGPPRDPAAWLILVGRNVALDGVRRKRKQTSLPDEDQLTDLEDVEAELVDRLDSSDYRDDLLRLLFVCCHPELPNTQQIALALRIVSGLSVKQIARAFLVGEAAMEQRITRAKGTSALAMRAFARVIRCSIAASPTRNARAICFTESPETMRSASAICCVFGNSGWQQTNRRRSRSSR